MTAEPTRILIVEDEGAHAEAISRGFRTADYDTRIFLAGSLADFRRMAAEQAPHIVLLDYNLPDGRAVEVLTAPVEAAEFPVLIMTSHGSEVLAVEAMKAGALDYIVKSPQAFAEMPKTVSRALREWRALREHRRVAEALRHNQEQLQKLSLAVEQSPAAVVITNLDAAIEYVNPKFTQVTGYTLEEVRGKNPRILQSGEMPREDYLRLWQTLLAGREWHGEFLNKRKDGSLFWEQASISPLRNDQGRVTHYIAVKEDITARKRYEMQLEHQATHDDLTGLANRALLHDRLEQAIHQARRSGRLVAVLLLDLDRFKLVNDSLGHAVGDKMLCQVGERLRKSVREVDTVARLGGDEFVILLTEICDIDDVGQVAAKILRHLGEPLALDGREISIGASLGLSIYPRDASDGATLIRNADIAMYRAKQEGGSFSFYANEMNLRLLETLELESALRQALDRRQFCLHYQPKVGLTSGRVLGCEALIRWQHPQRGMISPAEFIPLAEETGLIVPIGHWALREACRQTRQWLEQGLSPRNVAVNLSARQFRKGDLVDVVRQVLAENALDPDLLELELTESMIMDDPVGAEQTMRRLKNLGVGLSLDDFGTGYSSLNYLRRFPVDSLKIDRSFIADVVSDPSGSSVVTSVISIAHNLGLSAIAEGVETSDQLDFLVDNGCDMLQGYIFSKPMPADEYAELLRRDPRLECPGTAWG
ncbi:putative bifunctional diguanylate cyclase/phosphodiesterase [Geoalkalibacter sp.]|uniref:putative bifunctional diguanylate cyclase/phosphodiesterase n=1 Tax=Geoalkalibacter sp. TaxID=3041440 RepID=UPI00272DE4F7|nr:EAL domain-containing protein [Geoalkalibacter sp.]